MNRDALEAHYRRYIACLNARQIDEAKAFYADRLLYNGKQMSRDEWCQTAILDVWDAMPDLQWHIEHLVIHDGYVAARLRDTATPQKPWQGLTPSGTPSSFGEHVFYRFRQDGQTDEVWSIADVTALQKGGVTSDNNQR